MELAPGKLEKNLPGGKGVLAALLKEFRNCEFNGMIHTSVYRGDDAADGILLFRNGKEIVAGHLAGRNATNGTRLQVTPPGPSQSRGPGARDRAPAPPPPWPLARPDRPP